MSPLRDVVGDEMIPRRASWIAAGRAFFHALCAAVVLSGCLAVTAAHAQTVGTRHELDRNESVIYVVTKRAGLLSFLGHDHSILAGEWLGSICASDAATPQGHGSIAVRTASLEIDSDSARALAGLGRGPGAEQRRILQQTVLDERHLAADSFPSITIDVEEIVAADGTSSARGRLTIRARTLEVVFPVQSARVGDTLRIEGALQVSQSDFGIRPESIAGLVKVADRVAIHFDLIAVDTRAGCRD